MPIIIQILLAMLFLSFPIVFFRLYLKSVENNSKRTLESQMNESSELYKDLKVWTKNFDVFKKKNKFDLDPYQTHYSFNDCDLILNDENFIVIGKAKFFGKKRYLTPTTFEYIDKNSKLSSRQVVCIDLKEIGQDLEIEFRDNRYSTNMTLVIKRIDNSLKEKIKTGYNNK